VPAESIYQRTIFSRLNGLGTGASLDPKLIFPYIPSIDMMLVPLPTEHILQVVVVQFLPCPLQPLVHLRGDPLCEWRHVNHRVILLVINDGPIVALPLFHTHGRQNPLRKTPADDGGKNTYGKSRSSVRVPVWTRHVSRQRKGDRPPKTGEPQDELHLQRDLVHPAPSTAVGQEGEGEDVECPRQDTECHGKDGEGDVPALVPAGEHPHTHIEEYHGLGHGRQSGEDLLRCYVRCATEVVGVVVRQDNAVEEERHDARELQSLGKCVAAVAKQEEEGGLKFGKFPQGGVPVDVGRDKA